MVVIQYVQEGVAARVVQTRQLQRGTTQYLFGIYYQRELTLCGEHCRSHTNHTRRITHKLPDKNPVPNRAMKQHQTSAGKYLLPRTTVATGDSDYDSAKATRATLTLALTEEASLRRREAFYLY